MRCTIGKRRIKMLERRHHSGKEADVWHSDVKLALPVNGLSCEILAVTSPQLTFDIGRLDAAEMDVLIPPPLTLWCYQIGNKSKCWMTEILSSLFCRVRRSCSLQLWCAILTLIVLLLPDLALCLFQRWNKRGQHPHRILANALLQYLSNEKIKIKHHSLWGCINTLAEISHFRPEAFRLFAWGWVSVFF